MCENTYDDFLNVLTLRQVNMKCAELNICEQSIVSGMDVVITHTVSNVENDNLKKLKMNLYKLLHYTPDRSVPDTNLPTKMLKYLNIAKTDTIVLTEARYLERNTPILFFCTLLGFNKNKHEQGINVRGTDCQYLVGINNIKDKPEEVFEIQRLCARSLSNIVTYKSILHGCCTKKFSEEHPYLDFDTTLKGYLDRTIEECKEDGISRHVFVVTNMNISKDKSDHMQIDQTMVGEFSIITGVTESKGFITLPETYCHGIDSANFLMDHMSLLQNQFKEGSNSDVKIDMFDLVVHDSLLNTMAKNYCIFIRK